MIDICVIHPLSADLDGVHTAVSGHAELNAQIHIIYIHITNNHEPSGL